MTTIRSFSWCVAILTLCCGLMTAPTEAASIGSVTRIRGDASAESSGQKRNLTKDAEIDMGDRLTTGPAARLEIKFADGTTLTLGEKADFTIDDLTISKDSGIALFTRKAGAVLLSGGDIAKLPNHKIEIASNAGTIGIRGTTVWGGTIKDKSQLDVFLIEGAVEVRSPGGTVVLDKPGLGTSIGTIGAKPDDPTQWQTALRDRAVATVSFDAP
ncbi:MAG TPA: FecR family protein [Magnetospirillaceae bacterium]|jgi:hypothetical protein